MSVPLAMGPLTREGGGGWEEGSLGREASEGDGWWGRAN